jgi:hypothetical protein
MSLHRVDDAFPTMDGCPGRWRDTGNDLRWSGNADRPNSSEFGDRQTVALYQSCGYAVCSARSSLPREYVLNQYVPTEYVLSEYASAHVPSHVQKHLV